MNRIPIEKYKVAMRVAVCGVCVYFTDDKECTGKCLHENSGKCSLFCHLPEVVDVVSVIHSNSIDIYAQELRKTVCANCSHQDQRRFCDLRDSWKPTPEWCTLDAYFNLVVGAVEDVEMAHSA